MVVATQPVTESILLIALSCGHRFAIEGKPQEWPIGREYTCAVCEHAEPYITRVEGGPYNLTDYTLFLSCGHFYRTKYHHRMTYADVTKLLNTHQFCLQCAQERKPL